MFHANITAGRWACHVVVWYEQHAQQSLFESSQPVGKDKVITPLSLAGLVGVPRKDHGGVNHPDLITVTVLVDRPFAMKFCMSFSR